MYRSSRSFGSFARSPTHAHHPDETSGLWHDERLRPALGGLVGQQCESPLAVKHGKGRITVKLESHAGKGYALSVCNEGSTLPEGFDPTACDGLGMHLVSALVTQIGGALQIDRGDRNDCTRFTVLFA